MKFAAPKKALIYCRVSSKKQAKEGHGLDSQEARCREYAAANGLEVAAVFPDDVSGGGDFMKRPGMLALLCYLDAQPRGGYVVIFDDLKRFARDTEFHLQLRRAFKTRKAEVKCLNFNFEDTPEGRFIETILAAQGELDREQNARQVTQKMRARLMSGYWAFRAPIGYRYERRAGHGKLLVRNEPLASIVAEVLEGFASGRLGSITEVKRFLEAQPAFPRNSNDEVHETRVIELLSRPIYAGHISVPDWNLHLVPGKHEPLISLATYQAIQDRRLGVAKVPARVDLSEEFPLRGFVACGHCGEPLTGCWSKGRSARYAYYLCDTRHCAMTRKSIRREEMEKAFENLLRSLKPSEGLFNLAYQMFRDFWEARIASGNTQGKSLEQDIRLIERKIEALLDRIVDANGEAVIAAYEKRIAELETQKALMRERIANCGRPLKSFGDTYRTAFDFLANPYNLWTSPRIEDRRAVLKLVFADRLTWVRGEGYRTAKISMPFKVLGSINMQKKEVVEVSGIEPPTSCMPCKRSPS
jgi:site-specific DNA recombinase